MCLWVRVFLVCVFVCFECVFWGVLVFLCVCLPGACVCWRPWQGGLNQNTAKPKTGFTNTTNQDKRCRLPKWFLCRFVLIGLRRKERSSRTESTRGILGGYLRGPYRSECKATAQTLHRHGVSSPVHSVTHTLEHAQLAHKHAHSPSVSLGSVAPSRARSALWSARVPLSAHVRLCRSLA